MESLNAPQRVLWEEGLFIGPHHFQQLDRYHELLLDARLRALHPYPWGVAALELDLEALQAGQVQLLRFAGVLPDGLPLSFSRGDPEAPPARHVEGHFPPAQSVLDLYLGVPKERSHLESTGVGTPQRVAAPRFTPVKRPIRDLQVATSVVTLGFAQRNVSLLFGSEPLDDFEVIKIAELSRDPASTLVLAESHVPPCLRIDAAPYLLRQLRELLRLVTSKQRLLTARRRHRTSSALEFGPADVTLFLELNLLNGLIPLLQHAQVSGGLSPEALYLLLIQAAGQLCSFAPDGDPVALPPFQFTELRKTFQELFARLFDLLRHVALAQHLTVPLALGPDQLYRGLLGDPRLERCAQFVLAVRSDLPENTVAESFPKLAKLSSEAEIGRLVDAATPGIALQINYRPPPEIPVQPGVIYFNLSPQDGYWRDALRERTLALHLPQPFDPSRTEIELLAVPAAGQ